MAAQRHRVENVQELRNDRIEAHTIRHKRLLEIARLEKRDFDTVLQAQAQAGEEAMRGAAGGEIAMQKGAAAGLGGGGGIP